MQTQVGTITTASILVRSVGRSIVISISCVTAIVRVHTYVRRVLVFPSAVRLPSSPDVVVSVHYEYLLLDLKPKHGVGAKLVTRWTQESVHWSYFGAFWSFLQP